jgi:peptidoglycan/xylan/chitin deacetylase (PgdA/CDA1 family)
MRQIYRDMIQTTVRKLLLKWINLIPQTVLSRIVPRDSFVFEYHLVSDEDLPHIRSLYPYKSQRAFAEDLDYLEREFDLLGYEDFINRENGARAKGKPAALITFDDGLAECYHVVRPMLLERGIPAIFFVTTDFIDNRTLFHRHAESLCIERIKAMQPDYQQEYFTRLNGEFGSTLSSVAEIPAFLRGLHKRDPANGLDKVGSLLDIDFREFLTDRSPYLSRDQIVQMVEEGFTIGAHSLNHPNFKDMEAELLERQIAGSCETIAEITGRKPVPFAFPYAMTGLNRGLLADIARKHNSTVGVMFGTHGILLDPPYVNRINADSPGGAKADHSNIPLKIREAYARYPLSRLHRLLS